MDALEILNGNQSLVVSFGGYGQPKEFEFMGVLGKYTVDKIFLKDTSNTTYHGGVKGISTDIESTMEYLRTKIQGYSKVLFLGASGGGYGAILFGSLLNITAVLSYYAPTKLIKPGKDPRYKDLKPLINKTTKYYIHGDNSVKNPRDPHHFKHCLNIEVGENVIVTKHDKIPLKEFRNAGELHKSINFILH